MEELRKEKKVIWSPQPKQIEFMQRPEYEAFYGGAAGGGKSDSLLMEALRQVNIPHYKGLIIRKTYPELSELIDKSLRFYGAAFPKAKYNGSEHVWKFPSGAKIYFGSLHHAKDKIKYQGKEFDFIGFDELTHFTWDEYSYLFSRNRPSGKGTRVYMRATGNPGGIGHGWVKSRFITAAPPKTTIWESYSVEAPDGGEIKMKRDRIFIPSTVFDNPALLQNNPEYLASLAMMSESEKKALLYGDWDCFSGQVFSEWRDDPAHYADGKWTHVIEPFDIPDTWRVYRSFDFGYAKPFSVGWWAVDFDGRLYRILELYGCVPGEPDTGVRWTPEQIFTQIRATETTHPYLRGRDIRGVADPAIWDASRGDSIADIADRYGVYFEPGDHKRLPGWMQVHYRLAFDQAGLPMLYVFRNCRDTRRTLPLLRYDAHAPEDVDTRQEDHIADEIRYLCQSDPIAPRPMVQRTPKVFDPLSND